MLRYAGIAPPPRLGVTAIMVLALITNLISDPQKSEEQKLATGQTLSQYPPMTGHMEKTNKGIPHRLSRISLRMDTTKTRSFPAIRPICRHQSIRASPAVEGPQAEIRRYLAPDGCKFQPGKAHVSSGEPRGIFEFKLNTT
jgi:hypothetical protein